MKSLQMKKQVSYDDGFTIVNEELRSSEKINPAINVQDEEKKDAEK